MKLLLGDCLDKLKELDDNSIDSIVTDPPYGLSAAPNSGKSSKGGFMGKKWDYDVPSQEIWEECMRVLKPGGHLLSFAGSRTYHRMAVRIEDAGFEIRDQIMWIYGSGFPKSMNISKYIDKQLGTEKIVGKGKAGKTALGQSSGYNKTYNPHEYNITEPGSELAEKWNGWGTALKPAHEPIVMARKPLSEKTVVDNVLEWGTGGINIDESRIGTTKRTPGYKNPGTMMVGSSEWNKLYNGMQREVDVNEGRFPANIIFDEEAGKLLDEQSGTSKSTGGRSGNKEGVGHNGIYGQYNGEVRDENPGFGDVGGASRFFYCPKTSKTDRNEGLDDFDEKKSRKWRDDKGMKLTGSGNPRNEMSKNFHPTVKPTDLMLYLIRLVTPKGGTTLDPFMGSGSTGKAAIRGGFDFIGIEREEEYMEIATARIQYEIDNPYNEEKEERVELNKNSQRFW
jgi:site-specific DNA-methyltransferase (adenine-specific)